MRRAASTLGLELVVVEVGPGDDIAVAMTRVTAQAPALAMMEEPYFTSNARKIAALAEQQKLPMIGYRPHAHAGALMEYGVNIVDLFARSAFLVDKILKGTPPADLPIERAVKFDLVINLKTAKVLGLEIPPTLLARADEVIE